MPYAKSLGRAYAWLYGEQWIYSRSCDDAPEDAVEVEGLNVDGRLVLSYFNAAGGSFFWDAKPARVTAGE